MNKKILAFACFLAFNLSGQTQCLVFPACPDSAQTLCDLSDNHAQLWNESYWNDPVHNSQNLPEGQADLSLTVTDTCGSGAIAVRYKLYLDLDQDGAWETAVSSDDLPGYNTVYFGNVNNGNGTARAFDERPVMASQKYGFALQTTAHGDSLTARVRWVTEANPDVYVVPELPYGTHKIEWTVSQSGNEQACAYSFTVKDCKRPEIACINDWLSVNIMPTNMITLWNTDFLQYALDNVTPTNNLQYGIRRSGAGTGFPLTSDGNPQTNVTFKCGDLGSQQVEIWARDKAGNADYCQAGVLVQDNMFICGDPIEPRICVLTACGDKPLQEYVMDITGTHPALPPVNMLDLPAVPDANGCIPILGLPFGGNYMATPKKDNDPLNGVSTFDLVLINKHILGLQPFDAPYKSLAADANNSKSVTTFDIVELRKLILGIYTELPNNTSWRFYPADFVFGSPNPLSIPVPGSDTLKDFNTSFKAVKVGDVNCSATYNSAQAAPGPRELAALDLPDMALSAGQTYDLPLRVAAGAEWTGFQFAVELDPEAVGIEAVVPGALPGLDENAFAQTRPGLLTVSWFDAQTRHLPAGETILTLKIRALTDVVLSEAARLNTQRIGAEAYTGDGQVQALQLYFAKPASGAVQIFEPRPNPTAGAASFPIRLEQAGPVELRLSDLAGKAVFRRTFDLEAGLQEMVVPAEVLIAGGVYVWQMKMEGAVRSGKLVRQ